MAQRHAKTIRTVGLDFGTTNSALAVMCTDGTVQLATFQDNGQMATTFRSVLYFFHPEEDAYGDEHVVAGPQAIRSYLHAEPKGRFMQSIKSFLASRLFERTRVFTRPYTLEDLIAIIVRALRTVAETQFGGLGTAVVVGRPVHFAGAKDADIANSNAGIICGSSTPDRRWSCCTQYAAVPQNPRRLTDSCM